MFFFERALRTSCPNFSLSNGKLDQMLALKSFDFKPKHLFVADLLQVSRRSIFDRR